MGVPAGYDSLVNRRDALWSIEISFAPDRPWVLLLFECTFCCCCVIADANAVFIDLCKTYINKVRGKNKLLGKSVKLE